MPVIRSTIPDFMTANPLYVAASVTFYTVDEDGARTETPATLYAGPTGATTALNPQTLDGEGKFVAPVYTEVPLIAEVIGPNVGSHETGIIHVRGTWRGNWAADTVYFSQDLIADPVSGNIYVAARDYTAGASVSADVTNGDLVLAIDQTAIISGGAALAIKVPAACATTEEIALSGLLEIDGYQTVAGDRVLVKNQAGANQLQNGLYNAAAAAWTRCVDLDASAKFGNGAICYVINGTINRNKGFQLAIPSPFTLDTSAVTWTAIELPAGVIPVQFTASADAKLSAGAIGFAYVPYDCVIERNTLFGDAAGSIVIDIYKGTIASLPTPSDSIVASAPPALSSQQVSEDTTLTGWTTQLMAGDVLKFEILSVSGLNSAKLDLRVNRN